MPSSCKRQRTQSPNDSAAMLTVSVDSYPGLKAPLVSCSVLPALSWLPRPRKSAGTGLA